MNDLRFFISMIAAHRTWMLIGAGLSFLTLAASIALLTLAGWFITASALVGLAAPAALIGFNYHYASGGIRAFALIRIVSRYFERVTTHEATFRILAHLRHWFFAALLPLSPHQLAAIRSGDTPSRITNDIDALDNLYLRVLVPGAIAILTAILVLIFMFSHAPLVALAMAVGLGVAGIVVPAWGERLGRAPGQTIAQATADLRTTIVEAVEGLSELLVFGAYKQQRHKIRSRTQSLLAARAKLARTTSHAAVASILVSQVTLVTVVVIGAMALARGALDGPALALLVFCTLASFEAVTPLGTAWAMLGRTKSAARRLLNIAEMQPLVSDAPTPLPVPKSNTLSFENVSFTYPDGITPVLDNLTLNIPDGRKIALVGSSGGGKSTTLALALRLYDPINGAIRLGGTDLKDLAREDLWRKIGFLSQDADLFSASIRGNILLGCPSADENALANAVRLAGLSHFVAAQPQGLDTWVGETGTQVSGGEARRIAMARVILKDAPILLLDEPTEGLDAATQHDVLEALRTFAAKKTVIMVTHRKEPLAWMDETWIMEDGIVKLRGKGAAS